MDKLYKRKTLPAKHFDKVKDYIDELERTDNKKSSDSVHKSVSGNKKNGDIRLCLDAR